MAEYKLDRTVFKMHHTKDSSNNLNYWKSRSIEERLKAANYLNSVAYDFPAGNPPKIDRTLFKIKKRK